MKLRIVCCGKFHYVKYFPFIAERGDVELVFSHKISTLSGVTGAKNIFLKQYIFHLVALLIPDRWYLWAYHIAHAVWRPLLRRALAEPAETIYFLAHGNCDPVFEVRGYKPLTIASVVNAHPARQRELLYSSSSLVPENILNADKSNIYFDIYGHRIIDEAARADFVIAPSEFVRQSFIDHGFSPEKIEVLTYGLERPLERSSLTVPPMTSDRPIELLCVGQVCNRKGQHLLLAAASMLEAKGIRTNITLVGRAFGPYLNFLSSMPHGFKHIKHIDNREMIKFMSAFDIFVLPSLEDGFAVVVGEALSAGVPAIVSSTTGARDLFKETNYGVFESGDVRCLAECIEGVITHGYEATFDKNYSWKEYGERLISLVERIHVQKRNGR